MIWVAFLQILKPYDKVILQTSNIRNLIYLDLIPPLPPPSPTCFHP